MRTKSVLSSFGSTAKRFDEDSKKTSEIGPGHYKINKSGTKSVLLKAGSSNFKSPGWKDLFKT